MCLKDWGAASSAWGSQSGVELGARGSVELLAPRKVMRRISPSSPGLLGPHSWLQPGLLGGTQPQGSLCSGTRKPCQEAALPLGGPWAEWEVG